jgi:capsular polysaccharide biosynthesis protein
MGSSAKKYIQAAIRWAWLVVLAAVIAGAIAYYIGQRQPRSYEAATRLVVGPGITAVSPDLNDMRAAAQLMWIYAEFATSDAVLQQVIDDNNLPTSVDELRSKINASPDQTTLWLTLRVRSKDEELPVVVANGIANALVNMSPAAAGIPENQTKTYIGEQIKQIEQELSAAEEKRTEAEAGFDATKDPLVQRFYQDQITQQRVYAADLRSVLTTMYNLYRSTYTNQIAVVEPATELHAIDTNVPMGAMLAALAGVIAALGIVFTFVYFDDAIHTPDELRNAIGLPLLGVIGKHKPRSRKKHSRSSSLKRNEKYLLREQQY